MLQFYIVFQILIQVYNKSLFHRLCRKGQGQDSRLKMRTFLKPASLGYGVNKQ